MTEKIIRAALYIRVSTEEQVRHGYSLDSQRKRLLEYCKEKKYKPVEVYVDEGKSARSKLKNRKALLKLVDDASKDKYDIIIMWRLDRWFRNIADYYKIQETLEKYKIEWECSDEEYNTNTSNGRLHLNIKLSIAQNESDQTGDRIKFNFNNMVKEGYVIVGKNGMPLGYTISNEEKNKRMIIDPEEEQIAKDMWENIQITGSIRRTLIYINQKYNRNICYDSMRHYLMNPKYYGYYRGVDNYCPAYVTKQEFDNVQKLIKKNVKFNKKYDYIFSGLLKCNGCGYKLSGFTALCKKKSGKEYRYPSYRCNRYHENKCTFSKNIVENTIEKYMINNIKDEINKYILNLEEINLKEERNSKVDINKLNQRLDRLADLYLDERISKEKYDLEYFKIKNQLNQIEVVKARENDYSKLKKILNQDISVIYANLSNNNKRNFWASFIEYIEITPEYEYHIQFKN